MDAMTKPEPPPLGDWRRRIPPEALAEAERLGPLPREQAETDEDRAERLAIQQRHRQARWAARLPVMFTGASLEQMAADPEQADAAATLARWAADPTALNLMLAGPVGTGKTHAAYAIGNALVADQWVEAWTVADLLTALRPDGDPTAAQAVRDADVLVLDDLGATKVSEWAQETLTALLDARLREQRRTIITTNLPSMQTLTDAWGGRFTDRLRFRSTAVVLSGTSRRRADW